MFVVGNNLRTHIPPDAVVLDDHLLLTKNRASALSVMPVMVAHCPMAVPVVVVVMVVVVVVVVSEATMAEVTTMEDMCSTRAPEVIKDPMSLVKMTCCVACLRADAQTLL